MQIFNLTERKTKMVKELEAMKDNRIGEARKNAQVEQLGGAGK